MSISPHRAIASLLAALALILAPAPLLEAAVTRIEIEKRLPYAEGREFAGVGAYQRLLGKVYFAVDPDHLANEPVVDLDLAPRNAEGLVEFAADLEILAPVDLSNANGTLFYDVNNRGQEKCLVLFNEHADHFLMRRGYVVVWSGWIAELAPAKGIFRLDAPVATQDGETITGRIRREVVVDEPVHRTNISNRDAMLSYPPTAQGLKNTTLTWRLREGDSRVPIPRDQWDLAVKPVEPRGDRWVHPQVELVSQTPFQPGYIYELIYEAKDPVVQGLGLAGIRDLVSFLKYDAGGGNPLARGRNAPAVDRAIGFGISQSGRCLRVLTWQGFNADAQGRQVFDGLIPHVSGGGLGFFNHRFASPSRYAGQHVNHLYPCDMFPFAYGESTDPVTGRTDGILRRARKAGVVPKIMHIQHSAEYWHRSGSLPHTDPMGRRDAEIPDEVRFYSIGGAQHRWGDDVPTGRNGAQLVENPTDYRPVLRAMLVALDKWVRGKAEPPPSRYPRIADGTLVDWRQEASGWRALPGVRYPEVIQQPPALDYGPRFHTEGIISKLPPKRLGEYCVLVPAVGPDNNERGMLLVPQIAVPVATFTGWNLRHRSIGAENMLRRLNGAYLPFARTEEECRKLGDPRPALLERYRDFDDYLARFTAAASELVREGYLLPEDEKLLISRAHKHKELFEP